MKSRLFVILIILLSFIVRFYKASEIPPSLYWDEVAMGYNVYSLIQTGKDEYGHRTPFFFESFQDYKLPGYIYTLVPFIKFLGLTEIAIRLPAILFGTATVFFIYLLGSRLLGQKTGLLAGIAMAISPWHIQFTRAGYEASGALAFLILGIYLLHKGLDQMKYFHFGYISLILSVCFYNGLRDIAPGMFLFFLFFYFKKLIIKKKDILIFFIITLAFALPVAYEFLGPNAFVRFSYINIFSNNPALSSMALERLSEGNGFFSKVLYNQYLVYFNTFTQNYLAHFSPTFIFFGQDENIRHFVPNVGFVYLWRLPFILMGIYLLIFKKDSSLKILIPLLLISPVASSLTVPSPHALRALSILPVILIFSAVGLKYFFQRVPKFNLPLAVIIVLISAFSHIQYFHEYYFHYSAESSVAWAYGYKQVFERIAVSKTKYKNIFITGKYWRPYIFALYYLKYPPELYQTHPSHSQIDNMYFGYAGYDATDRFYDYNSVVSITDGLRKKPDSLLIISPEEKGPSDKISYIVNDLQGKPLFLFIETNPPT